jgi:hypothetical protein
MPHYLATGRLRAASDVTSLRVLKQPRHPFEAPTPTTSTAETVGALALGAGMLAADMATGGLLSALASIPAPPEREEPIDLAPLLATIADTSAPVDDGEGNVQCTRCTHLVPYATMSLNEDGYFCQKCAALVVRETVGE